MPPETFTWDRKELLRDRKHERSSEQHHYSHPQQHQINRGGGGGGGYGGVGGINGGGTRWREQNHLLSNPHHPYSHAYEHPSSRWISDGRSRAGPPGYGKQGGRHFHPEEEGHGFGPSRSSDKSSVDESFRSSGSGKFSRNNRESRSSYGQKEWKGHYTEATPSPNGSGRPNGTADQPRIVDEMGSSNSLDPCADLTDLHDQFHIKKQHEKNGSVNGTVSDPLKPEKENLLVSVDWKSIKWTRSGSLSSRGSGLSHSNSSRSMGADSYDAKDEVQQTNVSPIQSSSCDAANGIAVPSVAFESLSSPSEETSSRKKPRLGWGEGLAKYEKKKVVGVDDCETTNGLVCGSKEEQLHADSTNSADESHTVNALAECATPTPALSVDCATPTPALSVDCATPAPSSAVAISCSPGIEEKQFVKAGSFDHKANLNASPSTVSRNYVESFNLENLDLDSIACLNSAINKLLQSAGQSFGDSGFVRSTARNKLLVWKGDVLKAIEITESEIDKLEGQLKTMTQRDVACLQRSASSSLSSSYPSKPSGNHDGAADIAQQPALLNIAVDGFSDVHKMPNSLDFQEVNVKGEDVESPGSATSKLVEVPFSRKEDASSKQDNHVQNYSKSEISASTVLDTNFSKNVNDHVECDGLQIVASDFSTYSGDRMLLFGGEDKLHGSIWASNRDTANAAVDELSKFLPDKQSTFDIHSAEGISCGVSSEIIKAKLLRRKRFQQFNERVIALKFRVLQHFWKEDVNFICSRKFRVKSLKRPDHTSRALQNGHQKHHLSIRTGFSSTAAKLSMRPNVKMIKFVRKLISDSQLKPLRNALKMPSLILDNKEKVVMRFVSSNGLVEDPLSVEKERSMINLWTEEEREIFMDNLAVYGKDFTKIASFLTHKTTADCIEFYYKNHKSDFFKKTKKHPDSAKQGKNPSNNYLVTSGKRLICEANAASLDILGAASAIAANAENCVEIQQKIASRYSLGTSSKISRGCSRLLDGSSSVDLDDNERENVAADVLAGICSSLSSEAMGSCITGAVDHGEGYHERHQRISSSSWWHMEPEVTQDVDETCSDDSCRGMDPTDWTDEEKSTFIQSVSSDGKKDFAMISRCVRTRSKDECKIFFSKAQKCLALDAMCPGATHVVGTCVNIAANDMGNYSCMEADSGTSDDKPDIAMELDLPSPGLKLDTEQDAVHLSGGESALNRLEVNDVTSNLELIDAKYESDNLTNELQIDADLGTFDEKPVLDMEVDLPSPDLRSNTDQDAVHLPGEPSLNGLEVNDATPYFEPFDTKYQSGNLIMDSQTEKVEQGVDSHMEEVEQGVDSQMEKVEQGVDSQMEKVEQGVDSEDHVCQSSKLVAVQDEGKSMISSGIEAAPNVGEASDLCYIPDSQTVNKLLTSDIVGQGSVLSETRMSSAGNKVDANPIEATHSGDDNTNLNLGVIDDDNTQAPDIPSSNCGLLGNLQKVGVESDFSEKPCVITLQQSNYPVPLKLVSHLSTAANWGTSLASHLSPAVNWETSEVGTSMANYVGSIGGQQGSREVNGNGSCINPVAHQIIQSLNRNSHHDQHLVLCDSFLQRCNGTNQISSVADLPFNSIEQTRNTTSQLDVSLEIEKPRPSGKVKLFGQILTKPQQKPSLVVQQNGENDNHHRVGRSFSFRPTEDQSVVGYSAWAKSDGSSSRATDNAQVTSYGFWDGSRIQTGFSSLPNTAVLMAGFGNNSLPSNINQLQSRVVNGRSRSLNGLSILPARDFGNGPTDSQVRSTEVRPLALSLQQQRQELLLSGIQRRNNGLEPVSLVQQTARGIVGINSSLSGIVVTGQCSGVSDPVAAIRMHYAPSEQFNGQAANIISKDESLERSG